MREEEISAAVVAVLATLAAVVGLFVWARSADLGMAVFGFSLMVFGLAFDFWLVKRHFDALERVRAGDAP